MICKDNSDDRQYGLLQYNYDHLFFLVSATFLCFFLVASVQQNQNDSNHKITLVERSVYWVIQPVPQNHDGIGWQEIIQLIFDSRFKKKKRQMREKKKKICVPKSRGCLLAKFHRHFRSVTRKGRQLHPITPS